MHVIIRAANGLNVDFMVLADARHVRPQLRLKFFRDEFAVVLRAEDYVHDVLRVRMRHVSRLRRLVRLYTTDPGLPPWARYISHLRRWCAHGGSAKLILRG